MSGSSLPDCPPDFTLPSQTLPLGHKQSSAGSTVYTCETETGWLTEGVGRFKETLSGQGSHDPRAVSWGGILGTNQQIALDLSPHISHPSQLPVQPLALKWQRGAHVSLGLC